MAITRPTSRQLQGYFNALRASKSNVSAQVIDIAPGNYGQGRIFPGATSASDPSWAGATETFYIYIDRYDNLILGDTSFPDICTKIAKVVIVSGLITDIIDERAEVNGLVDAQHVAFYDGYMSAIYPADTIQDAIEILDGYVVELFSSKLKYKDFSIDGGLKNGYVNLSHVDDVPLLEFTKQTSGTAKVRYTVSIPSDWVEGTDIVLKIFWSAATVNPGNINWQISYRSVTSGLDSIDITKTILGFVQSAPGVVNKLINTDDNLFISASNVSVGDMLAVSVERNYSASDTFDFPARVHLVRMEYMGS